MSVPEKRFVRHARTIVTSYEVGPLKNVPRVSEVVRYNDGEPLSDEEMAGREFDEGEVELFDGGEWSDEAWYLMITYPFEKRPYADITVTVADPRYLKHLTPGLRFRTTSWR